VGVSEIVMTGVDDLRVAQASDTPVVLPCGSTPALQVSGTDVPTRGRTTIGDLLALKPVLLSPCTGTSVKVPAGRSRVRLASDQTWTAGSVLLRATGAVVPTPTQVMVKPLRWGTVDRTVEIGARDQPTLLAVRENENPGWQATYDRTVLRAVTVDGWQQGWVVPAGLEGTVHLTYLPDRPYRAGLAAGLLAAVLVLALALLPERRSADLGPGTVGPGTVSRWGVAAVLTGFLLLGGVTGAVVVLAVLGLSRATTRWAGRWRPWGAAGGMAVAALILARDPWASPGPYAGGSAWPQLACLVGLAAVAAPWGDLARHETTESAQRPLEQQPAELRDQEGE
jgi:arabinofuranan 3-O-arabinosyltransferase